MIRVDREAHPRPPSLDPLDSGLQEARRLARVHFETPYVERRQVRFRFVSGVYASPDVREALAYVFSGKCAYCESRLLMPADIDVDHFRPRTFASSLEGTINEDHYWWLAYEWENLYAACAICSRNKGRRFPVADLRADSNLAGDALRVAEQPLIIDPCHDDPDLHLVFDDHGSVADQTPRGRVTIDVFGLNRPALVEARGSVLRVLLADMALALAEESGERWLRIIEDVRDPGRPYLAAVRQLVAREVRKRAGIRGDGMPIDRLAQKVLSLAGGALTSGAVSSFLGLLPSIVPLGSQIRKMVSDSIFQERSDASFNVDDARHVDLAYFRKTRIVESVDIKDFRKIQSLHLDFTKSQNKLVPWTMLLGENGIGKSSILQAIGLAMIGHDYIQDLKLDPAHFIRQGARQAIVSVRVSNLPDPIVLRIGAQDGFVGAPGGPKVLILGYGATRLMRRPGMTAKKEASYAKVDNLFDPFVPISNVEDWLLTLPKAKFDDFARAFKELLFLLEGPERLVRRGRRIVVETRTGAIPVSQLSDGYQSVIGVTGDIMRILSGYWPAMEVAEGIVLIDELGSHLHPRWRMKVVSGLRRAFPRVQFIASTHDPLCLRGLETGEVIVLREDGQGATVAIGDASPLGSMRIEQLLTSGYFGLFSTLDPDLDARFSRYLELLREQDGPEDARSSQAKRAAHRDLEGERRELETLRRELDGRMLLGRDRRERMMLSVIDRYLATERVITDPVLREKAKLAAQVSVAAIWRSIVPEVDGAAVGDGEDK